MAIAWTLLIVAYFLGSIPTGYLVGRMAGIDIREHGSGSTGATNVWRIVGRAAGISVFAVDLGKGLAAVFLMQVIQAELSLESLNWFMVGAAMMALLGHSCSVWIGFKGGKSVATGLGVLLALNWAVAISAFGVWLATMAIWRTVSISSILAGIAAPVFMLLWRSPLPYSLLAIVGGSFVVWRHRSNIKRLIQGTELSINPKSEN
jgi:acyl phosphate:glycerol-3-phosphate acyltransferase